ncbi:MAG: hypothetical protein IJS89_05245 [Bacteroidaceae bacterium]|nr:hypothetical protein [Bacteroidaceae bacterium]
MKKILFTLLLLLPLAASAQDDVIRSICGVRFGSSMSTCRATLDAKYGDTVYENEDEVCYGFKSVGGVQYDFLTFTFARKGRNTYLNQVELEIVCETRAEANQHLAEIVEAWKQVYDLTKKYEDDGTPYWCGGTNPLDSDRYGFIIETAKSELDSYPWKASITFGYGSGYGYGE